MRPSRSARLMETTSGRSDSVRPRSADSSLCRPQQSIRRCGLSSSRAAARPWLPKTLSTWATVKMPFFRAVANARRNCPAGWTSSGPSRPKATTLPRRAAAPVAQRAASSPARGLSLGMPNIQDISTFQPRRARSRPSLSASINTSMLMRLASMKSEGTTTISA